MPLIKACLTVYWPKKSRWEIFQAEVAVLPGAGHHRCAGAAVDGGAAAATGQQQAGGQQGGTQ
ncbi:hypothetical protein ADT31_01465 [Xylella fastidiosa]|nr:hypothetical protein ADT31_01465 [Xylella fastidiosa]